MSTKSIAERLQDGILILDGAMGTQIQAAGVAADAWADKEGCNEYLNLAAPNLIEGIHRAYLEAGCDALETNTFGASRLGLAEYGLDDETARINRAAADLARRAVAGAAGQRFVFGAAGPGTRLPSLGQVSFDELRDSYLPQFSGLREGGVDAFIIETCQDPLQIKAALDALLAVFAGEAPPFIYVSITIETNGAMLVGTPPEAITAILQPYPIGLLGLNCAVGPERMLPHLEYLRDHWTGPIACMPNAGMPILREGLTTYPLGAREFGEQVENLARRCQLAAAGGCCGTSPAHLKAVCTRLTGFQPRRQQLEIPPRVASLFGETELEQTPPPLYIGERGNATGSKKFREALLADDFDRALDILTAQEDAGAHLLDLSCAYAGRDEEADLPRLTEMAGGACRAPLVIDSTSPRALEAALKRYGGRAVINSVNLENGPEAARQVIALARRFGAALICLCIGREGMAKTAREKTRTARELVELCRQGGLASESILVDPLTFSVASGDPEFAAAAAETAEAIGLIKQELPGIRTVVGLSNVSYGLTGSARRVLNAVFLETCLARGLDACLVNIAALAAPDEIPAAAAQLARELLDNRRRDAGPLERYLEWFARQQPKAAGEKTPENASVRERLRQGVIRGRQEALPELVESAARESSPQEVLDDVLIPAMQEVGMLFNQGSLQLPFVLKSAEVMKKAVDLLSPLLPGHAERGGQVLVLATVAGDVHDIGKNLVKIILSNNGIEVIDLGTRIGIEEIVAALEKYRPDALGLSGLLVKSVGTMAENLKILAGRGFSLPVLLGGAALTPEFVRDSCRTAYPGPVIYCRDAFASLAYLRDGVIPEIPDPQVKKRGKTAILRVESWPEPPPAPFLGSRLAPDLGLEELLPAINRRRLMVARWKFGSGHLSPQEHRRLLEEEAEPALEALLERVRREELLRTGGAYGFYPARRREDSLLVEEDSGKELTLKFPRQAGAKGGSLVDFFREDRDLVGFLAVTAATKTADTAVERGNYREYFFLHGLAAELAEVMAVRLHKKMLRELKVENRGERFAFGYPAAPDLQANRTVCRLLGTHRIGLEATESGMLDPETSIVALVAHHPQARHFDAGT